MQLSTLIGKPVLSPCGKAYGYVTDVRLTRGYKKLSCLVCADPEEEEIYLPLRAVLSVRDAVIATGARLSAPTGIPSPLGLPAYSDAGDALGTVADVTLGEDETTLAISGTEQTLTAPVDRAFVAETVILYPDAASKAAASHRANGKSGAAPKRAKKPTTPDIPAPFEEPHAPADEPIPSEPTPAPVRLMNHTNLLGRHVRRSVYDASGAPIAIAGERVTPDILSAARRAGKLLQLTVNTLTAYY